MSDARQQSSQHQKQGQKQGLKQASHERGNNIIAMAQRLLKKNPEETERLAKSALHLAELEGDQDVAAAGNCILAALRLQQREYSAAIHLANVALKLCRAGADIEHRQQALTTIGRAATAAGEYQTALEALLKNQAIQERHNLDKALAKTLMDISRVYMLLDAYSAALDYCLKSLTIRRRIGERGDISLALNNLGMIWSEIGDHSQALEFYLESLELQKQAPVDPLICGTQSNIAKSYLQLGDTEAALAFGTRSLQAARQLENKYVESLALQTLGEVNMQQGDPQMARTNFAASHSLATEIGNQHDAARALHSLALVALKMDAPQLALEQIQVLSPLINNFSMRKLESIVEHTLSEIHARLKNYELAYKHLARHQSLKSEFVDGREQKRLRDIVVVRRVEQWRSRVEDYRRNVDELAALNSRLQELHEEKNEFLGIAAHDLKNPLSGIVLTAEGLQDHIDALSKEEIQHRADVIHTAAMRMSDIIGSLLDINALESGTMQLEYSKFHVSHLILDLVDAWTERAKKKHIKIETEIAPKHIAVHLDPSKLHQVLDNLLSNAIKFSPPHSTVRISARGLGQGSANIVVQDQGPGLTPDDQERLYTKFGRLSPRPTGNENSTGLGLSIVKKLLNMMNANIRCESELGKGCRFTVSLPGNDSDASLA